MNNRKAFTLLELLVVIGIIAVLIAVFMPGVRQAREQAQRLTCANRLRQLAQATIRYGTEFGGKLPPATRDQGDPGEHNIWISNAAYQYFVRHAGSQANVNLPLNSLGDKAMTCPNMEDEGLPFRAAFSPVGSWVLGYNYTGNHPLSQAAHGWKSPQRLGADGSLPIWSDLNDWSPQDGWTIVPHRRNGTAGFVTPPQGGRPPSDPAYYATGGNVARLDGSVVWKSFPEMQQYEAYSGSTGAYLTMR